MEKKWIGMVVVMLFIAFIVSFNYIGCGGSNSSSGSSGNGGLKISGRLDNSTLMMAYAPPTGFLNKLLAFLSPIQNAYTQVSTVDNIMAVSPDGSYVFASKKGNEFSLSLIKGKEYVVVFLNGTTIIGIYKLDKATDMDAILTSTNSIDTNLGTVSVTLGMAEGTISSTVLLQNLGITQDVATAFGVMDEGLVRFSNIDVDGNNAIDLLEGKFYTLKVGYQFRPTEQFDDLFTSYSNKDNINFAFYFYVYEGPGGQNDPADFALYNWPNATLTPPGTITTKLGRVLTKLRNGTNDSNFMGDDDSVNYMNDRYISPTRPPQGTYTLEIPLTNTGLTKTLTFQNVRSFDMTGASFNYVYVPEVKLTKDIDGKITQIEWRWWKKASGIWVQPTDKELAAVWYAATYFINTDNAGFNPKWSELPITAVGSLTLNPPVQPSTKTSKSFQIGAQDKGRYSYSFDWWEGTPP
ncbi:MAG: hypothetical protein HY279_02820 [Nitrospinae bacterium]|nr:hypothetical protein [Nitrospinota bacterium]